MIELKVYDKNEVDKKVLEQLVLAGFYARIGDDEKKYVFLMGDYSDLNPRTNPYFKSAESKFVIAYKNGKPVGRIVISVDKKYNKHHKRYGRDPVVWFGWLEFDDEKTGELLVEKAVEVAKDYRKNNSELSALIGPGSPNENGVVGLRIKGDVIYFMEPNNPLRYAEIFKNVDVDENGWGYWYVLKLTENDLERRKNLVERVKRNPYKKIKSYGKFPIALGIPKKPIMEVYNKAWDSLEHPHGRPLDKDEINQMYSGISMLVPPNFKIVQIAYDGRKPIGVTVLLPNFNELIENTWDEDPERKKKKEILYLMKNYFFGYPYETARIFISGVIPEINRVDRSKIVSTMICNALEELERKGVKEVTMSQLAHLNKDVIKPTLRIKDKIIKGEYDSEVLNEFEELANKDEASIAAVYKIPI